MENYEAIMIAVDMESESKDWRDVVLHGRFQTVLAPSSLWLAEI